MSDQLTMRLEPPLPKLPSGLRPMLARPLPEPFDSDAHLFEPAWGGARALALIGPAEVQGAGDVRLVAEDGTTGPAPIDLAGLAGRVAARSAVLDGEIVVVDEGGKLDAEGLARRFGGGAGPAAQLPRVRHPPPRRPVPPEPRPRQAPGAAPPGPATRATRWSRCRGS